MSDARNDPDASEETVHEMAERLRQRLPHLDKKAALAKAKRIQQRLHMLDEETPQAKVERIHKQHEPRRKQAEREAEAQSNMTRLDHVIKGWYDSMTNEGVKGEPMDYEGFVKYRYVWYSLPVFILCIVLYSVLFGR